MAYDAIGVHLDDDVLTVTLDDLATLNASEQMAAELSEVFGAVVDGSLAARAVILTGAGRGFCSGADLSRFAPEPGGQELDMGAGLERVYHPLVRPRRRSAARGARARDRAGHRTRLPRRDPAPDLGGP